MHLNVQCLTSKVDQLELFLENCHYDVLCFSEHWATDSKLNYVNILGYNLVSYFCRSLSIHGGTAIFIKQGTEARALDLKEFCHEIDAEFCGILLASCTVVVCLYRSCLGNFEVFLETLEELLDSLICKYSRIILLGDFNINFKMSTPNNHLTDLMYLIDSYGLQVSIQQFTRIDRNSQTCIDNILTNIKPSLFEIGIIDPCLSDHLGQTIKFQIKGKANQFSINTRNLSNRNLSNFNNSLKNSDWSPFYQLNTNSNLLCEYLIQVFKDLIHRHFPFKNIKPNTQRPVNWFNDNLRSMRKTLASLKTISDSSKSEQNYSAFKTYKSIYRNEINAAKTASYRDYLANSNNKSRDSWKLLKHESNTSHKKIDSDIDAAEFNSFFCTIPSKIISTLPNAKFPHLDYLRKMPRPGVSLFLTPVVEQDVTNAIKSLKKSNCHDIYDINTKMVQNSSEIITPLLTVLINKCITEGSFPDPLKIAKVVPIFKRGNPELPENYRPISILPIMSKVVESVLKQKLASYFEKYKLLDSNQFGFRSGRSTIDAILEVVDDVVQGLDEGGLHAAALCDLSRAFDCVPHSILLQKLNYYGVNGTPLNLFKSYLQNRLQAVSVNNNLSSFMRIETGVPQGSILGPLLFIIYINDFSRSISPNRSVLYADDATLLIRANDAQSLERNTSLAIKEAANWFCSNQLKLNDDKTQKINFSFNNNLINGDSVKLLGIYLDDGLKWSLHIDQLCLKLSQQVYLLRQLKKSFDKEILVMVYFASIHSLISYGTILWGNSLKWEKVFKIQKRAIRTIEGVGRRASCRPLFKKYNIMTLPCIYLYQTLIEIKSHPEKFILLSHNHSYSTRSSNNLLLPRHRLASSARNSLNLNIYNKLSDSVKRLNLQPFKSNIKKYFVQNSFYSTREYMEAPTLT